MCPVQVPQGQLSVQRGGESFFGHLQEEFLHRGRFDSIGHFTRELDDYIHWYNHDRIKEKLKD